MELGELAHERHAPCRKDLGHVGQGLGHATGTLVADDGARHQGKLPKARHLGGLAPGQEALEEEVLARQAGGNERAGHGRGAGDDLHGKALVQGGVHQALARVGDARHACVGDKRHALPRPQAVQHCGDALLDDVLVAALQVRVEAKGGHELARDAGVLAQHDVGRVQRGDHARRGVLQVSDGRAHHGEHAGHQTIIPRSKVAIATRASQPGSRPEVFQVLKNQAGAFS